MEGTSFAACGEASDPQLVPTKRAAMHAWSLPCTYSPPPPWAPRTGGAGVEGAGGAFDVNLCEASFLKRREAPRPFFLPISSGKNGGAVVGPSCGSFASGQARKLIPSAGPPLPTTTTPLGRRGGPIGRVPGGTPANNGGGKPPPYSAWQFPRQPGFYQTGDHRSPLRMARRGRRAPRRRHKLRIARFAASGKARSLHCASSPHDDHSVGSPRGPIRRADDIRPYRAG